MKIREFPNLLEFFGITARTMVYTIFVDFANFTRMSPNTDCSNQGLISRFSDWPINCLLEEATVIKLNCKTSFFKNK